jgi:hypothetical protein
MCWAYLYFGLLLHTARICCMKRDRNALPVFSTHFRMQSLHFSRPIPLLSKVLVKYFVVVVLMSVLSKVLVKYFVIVVLMSLYCVGAFVGCTYVCVF